MCGTLATIHLASEKAKILFNKMQKYDHVIEFIKEFTAKVSSGELPQEQRRSNLSITAIEG